MEATKIAHALSRGWRAGAPGPNEILAAADAARDRGDWVTAAQEYRAYLELKPDHAAIWVQLGNMLKEQRELPASLMAYEKALNLGLDDSDTHLQIGHLHKIGGDIESAAQSYARALAFAPVNMNAFEELEHMGLIEKANDIIIQKNAELAPSGHLIVFDITDLVMYMGHHDNLSGIQRVQCSVIQAVFKYQLCASEDVQFISWDAERGTFRSVDPEKLRALLDDLALPPERRTQEFDPVEARAGRLYPVAPLGTFLRPGRTTVLLLGAAWVIPEYASLILSLKRNYQAAFVMLFHDLIPIYARETCDQGTAEVFKRFMDQVIPVIDHALCVSQSTARDLGRYCREIGYTLPPTVVTQLGTSFDEFFPPEIDSVAVAPSKRETTPFVLFVATIEGRKNHNFMFEVWRNLVDRGIEVPRLVCVGRLGWRAEAFLSNLLETDYLDGQIELRENVSDAELNALYSDCLFTVFPSVYEGWGLPIGESLGHGKLCVMADNSSLPEVAGEFGCVIPLDDIDAAADTIATLIVEPERVRAYEEAIAARFEPMRWEDVAQRMVDCAVAVQASQTGVADRPVIVPGREYPVRMLPGSFDGLVGRALMETMMSAFAAPILGNNARALERVNGLLARDIHWHVPEDWGSWARHPRAGLQMLVDTRPLGKDAEVNFYASLTFVGPVLGSRIRLLIDGIEVGDPRPVESAEALIVWALSLADLRRLAKSTRDGLLAINLQFDLVGITPAAIEASRALDQRGLTFGLKSFVFLGAGAMADRLRIAERNNYKLVG